MKYTSIDQWKSKMKKLSDINNVDVQAMQQRYILEEFARKISKSKHKSSIVLKGGFVVSALLGIDERKTRDIDFTYNSTIYSIDKIRCIIEDICNTDADSFFKYEIASISEEQLDDHYSGYSCVLDAINGKAKLHLKLDISNNTLIYPKGIETKVHSFIDDDNIDVLSYPIENIIAEKYETTLDRGEFNSRIRDLFDVHFLYQENHHLIDDKLLAKTIITVSKDRDTYDNLFDYNELIDELLCSEIFNKNFNNYKNKYYKHREETINDIFHTFGMINNLVQKELNNK